MAAGVYWIGADGNAYIKAAGYNGVQNWGVPNAENPRIDELNSFSKIADPRAPVSSGNTGGAASDPAIGQAIGNVNSALDRLGNQYNSGASGIDASYQNALNQLLGAKNQGQQTFDQNKQTNSTNYVGAKNTIGSQAGQTLSGLQRLLGSRGAGGGSAATIAAPQAVTRGATLQRQDAGNTFAQNQQGLDQNWGNYLQGYNNQVSSAANQRDQQKQTLQQQIDTNRASLLDSLAQLQSSPTAAQPYIDQANALYDKTANYTTAPINYQTQAYTPPSLSSYTTNPQQAAQYSGQGGGDYFSPFLSSLLGKKQLTGAPAY